MISFRAAGAAFCVMAGLEPIAAAAPAPLAVDSTGCLQLIKTVGAQNCTTKSSLAIDMVNSCSFAVRAQLCLRGANHLWVKCEAQPSLSPLAHLTASSCDSDGAYTFWGCAKFSPKSGHCGGDNLVGKSTNVR